MSLLVTVATFSHPSDAAVIMGILEAHDIRCFLKDEFTVQVQPFYSNAIGGVKLQVYQEDTDQAITLLKEGAILNKQQIRTLLLNRKSAQNLPFSPGYR